MYHVVASDLDGTLLSPDHIFTRYTKETLQMLVAQGIHFIFATGRHHIDVAQMRDKLALNAWMITSNGARVHDSNNKLVHCHDLPVDIVRELPAMVRHNPDIIINLYRNDEWLMDRHRAEELRYFQEASFSYRVFDPGQFDPNGVSKVFFICEDHHTLQMMEQEINARWGQRINASFSAVACLEIMAGGVSKGHALQFVAQSLGYQLAHCIAFGDGMNDQQMLSMAGKGCIMANAHQRLKDALPQLEIIGSNAGDAVARYLRHLYPMDAGLADGGQ